MRKLLIVLSIFAVALVSFVFGMRYARHVNTIVTPSHVPDAVKRRRVSFVVLDRETGNPVNSRFRLTDAKGNYWAPQGHIHQGEERFGRDIASDAFVQGKLFAYVPPNFDMLLPSGRYSAEIGRGLEYKPQHVEFEVPEEAQEPHLFQVSRWSKMVEKGWYSGDTHIHFLGPGAVLSQMKAEDLNVANILIADWGNSVSNLEDFTGAPHPLSTDEHIVSVGVEARHGYLGHLNLLGIHQPVFPLTWGGPPLGRPGAEDYPPVAHISDRAHAVQGYVSWAHFPEPAGELALDVALKKIDSVDILTLKHPLEHGVLDYWYRFLNCGFRLPASGATDKMTNVQVLGSARTYVRIDEMLTLERWLEALKAGRTFVTTGPMVSLRVAGREIGDSLQAPATSSIPVKASVRSIVPALRLELVHNGRVVEVIENTHQLAELNLETSVVIGESGWIAVRAVGDSTYIHENIPVFAHTSPIYIDVVGRKRSEFQRESCRSFLPELDQLQTWVQHQAVIFESSQRTRFLRLIDKARSVYASMAEGTGTE